MEQPLCKAVNYSVTHCQNGVSVPHQVNKYMLMDFENKITPGYTISRFLFDFHGELSYYYVQKFKKLDIQNFK